MARRSKSSSPAQAAPSVLVTGGTGFLGTQLVAALVAARGSAAGIRVLARQPSLRLEQLGVQAVRGCITEPAAVARALHGVQQVFHAAGSVSHQSVGAAQLLRTHVDGTRCLLEGLRALGAGTRVVVVSSSGTSAVSRDPDEVSDEASPYRLSLVRSWPYYVAKTYQEQLALQWAAAVDVVVVCPSLLLGPGDLRGSSTGQVERLVLGRLPVVPRHGGIALVDVRDAAQGCLLAMERGVRGERYMLSGANMTLENFGGRVAALAGRTAPRAILAPRTMRATGRLLDAVCRHLATPPPVTLQSIEMAEHTWYVNARRARVELNWRSRDPQHTLSDTVRDIQERCSIRTVVARAAS